MERIDKIRLSGVVPEVFRHTPPSFSEIWRTADVTFERSKRYMIEAASGTGKSSLCAYLFGARTDYDGVISFNGTDIRTLSLPEWQSIRRANIAYLAQDPALFPELTALQNIMLKDSLTGCLGEAKIRELLSRFGLVDRMDYPAGKLSIGQQQRVGLIRAIAQPFDFILLDEPVSHLDEANNRLAAGLVAEYADRYNAGVIVTSVGNPLLIEGCTTLNL